MAEETREILQHLETAADVARAADKVGLFKKLGDFFRPKLTEQRDWESEAVEVLREKALDELESLSLSFQQVVQILDPDFDWEKVRELDPTWTHHWMDRVSHVAPEDEERRSWWAQLMAGEIQQPGTYSLRTLAIMDVLSPHEANLFARLSPYVWVGVANPHPIILPNDGSSLWRPTVGEGLALQTAGLVTRQSIGYALPLEVGERLRLRQRELVVDLSVHTAGFIRCGDLILAEAGQQIWSLTDPIPDGGYRAEILNEWGRYSDLHEQIDLRYFSNT